MCAWLRQYMPIFYFLFTGVACKYTCAWLGWCMPKCCFLFTGVVNACKYMYAWLGWCMPAVDDGAEKVFATPVFKRNCPPQNVLCSR